MFCISLVSLVYEGFLVPLVYAWMVSVILRFLGVTNNRLDRSIELHANAFQEDDVDDT